ncbi:MAG: hypothetical protein R2747_10005 [Pyrinomonadaceae bacterium]
MQKQESVKLIEMTDLQWEFFFTCWKYNLDFYGGSRSRWQWSIGVPLYYKLLAKKLFGEVIKRPLWRFAGVPERFLRKELYLDFSGYKRTGALMDSGVGEIVPGFETVKGLNMVDAPGRGKAARSAVTDGRAPLKSQI